MNTRHVVLVGFAALAVGRASMKPTPEQRRVYDRAAECNKATSYTMNITYVSPDGRRFRFGEGPDAGAHANWKACMTQRFGYRF